MNNNINTVLKYAVIIGLFIIPFTPLYIANTLFFPFIAGKAFMFRVIVEIVFALWLILLLRERGTSTAGTDRSVAPRINSLTVTVTVFTLVIFIADMFGLNFIRSIWSNYERMEGFITISHLWLYYIVATSMFGEGEYAKKNWKVFLNIILTAGFFTAIYGLFQYFGKADIHQGSSRIDASLGNSAYMAVYMLINAFIALYLAIVSFKNKSLIALYSVLFSLYSFLLFQTATRGTILGWIASVLVICAIYSVFGRKSKGQSNVSRVISGSVIVIVIISGIAFYFNRDSQFIKNNSVLARLATISISDTKTQARGFIWPMAVKGVMESPKTIILGVGQENFNYIFNKNYNPLMWKHEQWFDRAHSVFLDWLVAGGVLGLIAYLSLYVLSLVYILKSDLTIGQKSVLIGLITGYGIHNIFVFDNQTSYIMFFSLLAYVHSFRKGKINKVFLNKDKGLTEDYITVRDYVCIPVVVIVFIAAQYFINVRALQANKAIVNNLILCNGGGKNLTVKNLEIVFKMDQTVANQEAREQLMSCISGIINGGDSQQRKAEFYVLANKEIEKQIATTPNDARIYIIAGSFYNTIGDYNKALPLLEKARQLSPSKQTIAFELALNYINTGKRKEAVELTKSTYELAKENDSAKVAYIISLISNNQESIAKTEFKDDKEIFKDPRVINAYLANKQYAKAIDLYKEILKSNPDDQNVYSALASAYLMDKQDYMAIQTLKDAAVKFPIIKTQIDSIIKQIQEGKFNR